MPLPFTQLSELALEVSRLSQRLGEIADLIDTANDAAAASVSLSVEQFHPLFQVEN